MAADIDAADTEDADAVVELWVALARGQRAYGSHLHAGDNREQIRDAVARHVITDGLRVARVEEDIAGSDEGVVDAAVDGLDEAAVAGIAGFVMFDLETGAYEQDVTRGVVRNLYVRPTFRGQGIGSDLLAAAERTLVADGADVVSLEAMMANEGARRFYTDHGYTPHRVEFEKRVPEGDRSDTHSKEGG